MLTFVPSNIEMCKPTIKLQSRQTKSGHTNGQMHSETTQVKVAAILSSLQVGLTNMIRKTAYKICKLRPSTNKKSIKFFLSECFITLFLSFKHNCNNYYRILPKCKILCMSLSFYGFVTDNENALV